MLHSYLVRFSKMAIACGFSASTAAFALGFFSSNANADIWECMGPAETMEQKEWGTLGGPLVPLSHWSYVEQTFITEYIRRFQQECMGLESLDLASGEEASYARDDHQDIFDRARQVCEDETGGYGTNWDNFVSSLDSFLSFCNE